MNESAERMIRLDTLQRNLEQPRATGAIASVAALAFGVVVLAAVELFLFLPAAVSFVKS